MRQSGFTLLELSIVLVIIGLIIGGVTVGNELIRQAALRGSVKQLQELNTVFTAFKLKYRYLPGDLPNATSYFPTLSSQFNGDGNGTYWAQNGPTSWSSNEEIYRLWRHLDLSGMFPNSQHGMSTSSHLDSKLEGGEIRVDPLLDPVRNNFFDTFSLHKPNSAVMLATEALLLDTKFDDGMPFTGNILTKSNNSFAPICTSSGIYNMDTAANCNLWLKITVAN